MYNNQEFYVDEVDPWMVLFSAAEFAIIYTQNILKGYNLFQFILLHDLILPIKHNAGW